MSGLEGILWCCEPGMRGSVDRERLIARRALVKSGRCWEGILSVAKSGCIKQVSAAMNMMRGEIMGERCFKSDESFYEGDPARIARR